MTFLEIALITQFTLLTAGIASFIEDRRVRHRRREKLDLTKHLLIGSLVGIIWVTTNEGISHMIQQHYGTALKILMGGLCNGLIAGFLSRSSLALISRHK
jgi:hypothetical protein